MKNKFIQQWKHSDSPFLWVETIYFGDVEKMKKNIGFCFGGHYFINKNQTVVFYENLKTEKLATKFGSTRYDKEKFVKKLCRGAKKDEIKLASLAISIARKDLKKETDKELKALFMKFFNHYASVSGYFRTIRPEFYKEVIDSLRKKYKNLSDIDFASLISGNLKITKVDNKTIKTLKLLNELAQRRYAMHNVWQKAFLDAEALFVEIGIRSGLSSLEVKNCTSQEIMDKLGSGKSIDKEKIRKRIKSYKLVYNKNGFSLISPWKEELFEKRVSEIKGTVAFGGKVRGRVVIVKESLSGTSKNIFKEITGDSILVTEMTSPDMVPAVKKALAVVTDVGGLLCHAAIIARELKKPCIIGTRIASSVLKTGDLVEVDADKGIVKIIKKLKQQ